MDSRNRVQSDLNQHGFKCKEKHPVHSRKGEEDSACNLCQIQTPETNK